MTTINRRAFMLTGTVVCAASACLFGATVVRLFRPQHPTNRVRVRIQYPGHAEADEHGLPLYDAIQPKDPRQRIGAGGSRHGQWERWYHQATNTVRAKFLSAGYKIIEVHFMQGFGIEGEKREYELTRRWWRTPRGRPDGVRLSAFFSVQKELFFLENPWAGLPAARSSTARPSFTTTTGPRCVSPISRAAILPGRRGNRAYLLRSGWNPAGQRLFRGCYSPIASRSSLRT